MALDMEEVVNTERTQPITANQKCLHVLNKWKNQSSASYSGLLDTLVELGRTPLAQKIVEDVLKEIISDSDSEELTDDSEDSDL